jgi:aminopeptidase C
LSREHLNIRQYSKLSEWQPKDFDELRTIAQSIRDKFATTAEARKAKENKNDQLAHSIYFIRDALMFCTFESAVSEADPGRVLRILRYWCLAFRGVGQHNYARECAEVLVRWKYEISEPMRCALEKSWFINEWGKPGRWIASDLYLEHLNYWVKVRDSTLN